MLLYTLKNEKLKNPKNPLEARFYCFIGCFFLMPILLVTTQFIPYLKPDKSKL